MPKVSIIMPLYNKEAYIANSIESVLRQSFSDYELVVVDDGSTDNSAEIVQRYINQDSRIILVRIKNGGVSYARNVGLSRAKGEWIQFLDADDTIEMDYLKSALKVLEKTSVDIIFSNFKAVDLSGAVKKEICSNNVGEKTKQQLCDLFVQMQDKNGFFGYISNKLISKALIEKSGATFSTDIKLAEDLDFYAKLYPHVEGVFFTNIESFSYLQIDETKMNRIHIDYLSQVQVWMEIRQWFIIAEMYCEYAEWLDKKVADYVYYSLFYAFEEKQNCEKEYIIIQDNQDAMSCINVHQHRGLSKWILAAMVQGNKKRINHLLWSRMFARNIYRRIRNCE